MRGGGPSQSKHLHQEGQPVGRLVDAHLGRFPGAVAGAGLDADEGGRGPALGVLERRRELVAVDRKSVV